jgi:DNA-binding MltR family transcriptional regulator
LRIFLEPVKEVEKSYQNRDFLTAFVLAETYFEYETNLILSHLLTDRLPPEILKELHLWSKLNWLWRLGLLDRDTHKKIQDIIQVRNKLVHPLDKPDKDGRVCDIFLRFRLTEKEKSLLLDFKECYSRLVQADSKVWEKKI